ncbi:MAG: ABC transporter permease, partial [Chloroflexi bacterium]|nr:ABC transporter permease [Chloroflexota bacterium]
VMMGFGTRIEVVADTESTSTRAALNNIASSIADQINAQQAAINATIGLMMENGIAINNIIIQQLYTTPVSASTPQININIIDVGNIQAENPSNYVIPGYLVMFTFFAAALAAETIVKERQNHTLERLLTCSVKKEAILGGMFMGTAARGLIQMIIFWTVAILVFKVDLGLSPEGVILLSLLVVIVSTSFGIMLATLAKTQRAASSIAILASLALAPLGGCWWPLFLTPKWMQNIAKVTPHGWATTGFNKLMVFGSDFGSAVPEMTTLIIFTLIFGLIAIWRFRAISK